MAQATAPILDSTETDVATRFVEVRCLRVERTLRESGKLVAINRP